MIQRAALYLASLTMVGQWAWTFLPDSCQIPGCPRTGVLGNENLITTGTVQFIVCDDCTVRLKAVRRLKK